MSALSTANLRSMLTVPALAAALCGMSLPASATRIFVPGNGIGASGDGMGSVVALSGDTAAIGIPHGEMTPHAAPGVIAIYRNVAGSWQSEAFLGPGLPSAFALQQDMLVVGSTPLTTFVRNGTTWSQHDVLNVEGASLALSGETLLLAGNPAATVYTRSNDAWTPQATLPGDQPNEYIASVSLDGDIAVIVGISTPTMHPFAFVHFYHRSGETWTLESTVSEGLWEDLRFIPTAVSGQTALVSVDAYVRDDVGNWSLQGTLDPLVPFSLGSIAIDGDRAIIGSPGDNIPGINGAGTAYVFERTGTTWSRTDHIYDPGATTGAAFGSSVALEGDTVVAGSPGAITTAGSAGDASVIDLGTSPATYVATLDAGNAHANEHFGMSVGAYGTTLIAGAPNANLISYLPKGAAYVFGLTSNGWALEAELQQAGSTTYSSGFGTSVAASTDTVVVGFPDDGTPGSAFVYTRGDGTWPQAARLAPDDDGTFHAFGQSVAFEGDRIAVGAPRGIGSVHLYTGSGSTWSEEAQLVPSITRDGDFFGNSLSLTGDTIVVGAPYEDDGIEIGAGLAFVFVNTGSGWSEQAVLHSPVPIAGTGFGASVAVRGDTALVGTNYASSGPQHVYVFQRVGTTWALETTLDFAPTTTDNYVSSLAISPDESTIAIGMSTQYGPGPGRAFTFVRDGGNWVASRTIVDDGPGNPGGMDGFGAAVVFLDESLLVGAPEDGAGGAVYQYTFGDAIFASGFDPVP